MTTHNLVRRGDQWWLQLTVPAPLRRFFLSSNGKPMRQIREPMGDSKTVAAIKASQRAAVCADVFAQCRAGMITTPEQARAALRGDLFADDPPISSQLANEYIRGMYAARSAARATFWETLGRAIPVTPGATEPAPAPTSGETISQAAEAWYPELERTKPRASTVKDRRDHVRAFIKACGDVPLTDVDRAKASDFLGSLKVSTQRRNAYANTLQRVFKWAARRGRFSKLEEDNPFHDQRLKVSKGEKVPRDRFTVEELQRLFDAMPRDVAPKKHSPETAVPWAMRIAAFTGAGLEEVCQLTVDDIREETVNGGRLWCVDIHNGDDEHKLKNEARPRLLPMHSALEHLGLLEYIANVRKEGHANKQLFPALKRRASKDNKIGTRVGEIFNKARRKLGITRKGMLIDFHSFRHTVSNTLEIAGVHQTDAARVLGHTIEAMSYGNYSQAGPGLIRVKAIVEQITYEGLRL
jgi:integrase